MVEYEDSESHFSDTLKTLNEFRLEKSLCDFSLVIGNQKTDAHRCILAAGSEYFRTRFCGPFKNENDHDIDLSDITENCASVESVVNFLYTGKIEIDQFNLESVLKLSSFFLISKVRDFCLKFMWSSLSLDTYLKYCLLAVDHGLPELEQKLVLTLKSRFHDCLIHRESSLEISPDQLSYLIIKRNVFEHCSTTDIIQYVSDWVIYGATEAHEILGCEIMDNIASKSFSKHNCMHTEEIFDENTDKFVQNKIQQMDTYDSLYKRKLGEMLAKHQTSRKSSSEIYSCKSLYNKKQPLSGAQHPYLENVLITVSPKACLRKDYENYLKDKYRQKSTLEDGALVYDICVYDPSTGVWYYLDQATKGYNIFNFLHERKGDSCNGVLTNKLWCVYVRSHLTFCELQDLSEKDISYEVLSDILPSGHLLLKEYCVLSGDQTVYLVLKVRIHGDDERDCYSQVYFSCYKLTEDDTWAFMFRTDTISVLKDDSLGIFCASVSTLSNEMIIACTLGTENLHIYVVNISGERKDIYITTDPCSLSDSDDDDDDDDCAPLEWLSDVDEEEFMERRKNPSYKEKSLHILQQNNHFYVVEAHIPSDPSEQARLVCKYRYNFNSKSLIAGENEILLDNNGIYYKEGSSCSHHAVASDENSIWVYYGNKNDGSTLTQVTIDEGGNFVLSLHTPPPFSYIASAVTGTVDMECLMRMKPLKHYLTD